MFTNFLNLFMESAPWILVGLLFAGIIKEFIPMDWINKQLGGEGLTSVIKASIFGAPLPLCSCGVIPAALGLRRSGASKAATSSFLISTPETGVDSISISYILLGPFLAIIRPIAAVTSGIIVGILTILLNKKEDEVKINNKEEIQEEDDCNKCKGSCKKEPVVVGFKNKLINGVKFAAVDLVDDITVWLLIGIFFAALVITFVPSDYMTAWGGGLGMMLLLMIISIPMYICASASTPIAAGLLLSGISPGAVLVFMLAGPATNVATLGVVYKELGVRTLIAYLGGVMITSLAFGYITNYLVENYGFTVAPLAGAENAILSNSVTMLSTILLTVLMLYSLYRLYFIKEHNHDHEH